MDLDLKVVSKEINEILWRNHKTLSTAESCTSGRVASVITAVPGASQYFKGGVVSYANEVKINLLGVDAQVIEEQTPVCEEVARQMVKGALRVFNTDYAVSVTGFAGPGGVENGKNGVLVGTIWIAVGNGQRIETVMLEEDNGRDKNLASATSTAMHMLLEFLKADLGTEEEAQERLTLISYIYARRASPTTRFARRTSQFPTPYRREWRKLSSQRKIIREKFVR